MKANLSKREFLQISTVGGVAAAMGLLTGTKAEAKKPPKEDALADLALSIAAVSYIGGLAFVVAGLIKFWQSKQNPTKNHDDALDLISAVWAFIDAPVAASLAVQGYSPYYLLDAVGQADDGDASALIAFFNELELLAG